MLLLLLELVRSLCLWIFQRRLRTLGFVLLALYPLHLLQGLLLGFGPTRIGGLLGRLIDNAIRKSLFESREALHEQHFAQEMGYELPELENANRVGVQVLLNNGLALSLLRRKARRDALEKHKDWILNHGGTKENRTSLMRFPMIQVNMGDWYRPVNWTNNRDDVDTVLEFDEEDVSVFMMAHFGALYRSVHYQRSDLSGRVQLFALAVIYHYGGIFVAPEITNTTEMYDTAPGLEEWLANTEFSNEKTSLFLQSINNRAVSVLAATPLHSTLKCAVNQLLSANPTTRASDWASIFTKIQHNHWDTTCEPECCPLVRLPQSETTDVHKMITSKGTSSPTSSSQPRFSVTITEDPSVDPPQYSTKQRCSQRLEKNRCAPGWLCNRCLRTALAGNLHTCRWVCRKCYAETVCVAPPPTRSVPIHVQVTELSKDQPRIPRIIHQTAFEPLSTARYPHFQRLQHSWKASGWEYRFYTDKDCIEFIQRHYPPRFLDAFQAIQPGAFKADLFRLLVLFKEGGIYADVDVNLDTHLDDNFITRELSFFVPRDVPVDYWPHANFCLWNGLMGAAPGHFILAKAIEDVINTIQNRVDYYDVEGRMCSKSIQQTEVWKLRTLPILILTGPCALGMSVNSAFHKDNILDGFDLGWLQSSNETGNHGHALVLLADRYDTGEMRFLDVDRNIVVASTNQDRLARDPIYVGAEAQTKKKNLHYSKTETDIVGEFGTYKDNLSAFETISIEISVLGTSAD